MSEMKQVIEGQLRGISPGMGGISMLLDKNGSLQWIINGLEKEQCRGLVIGGTVRVTIEQLPEGPK